MATTLPEAATRRATHRPPRKRAAPVTRTSNDPLDRDYWLGHCQGYRVDGHGGRIGFVEEVRAEGGRTVLAVRAGLLGRRILLLAADEVAFIVPQAQRIWLRTPATILGSEANRTGQAA